MSNRLDVRDRPDYLGDADEGFHEKPEGISMWSENYLSGVCFPSAGTGAWFHQSRPQHDTRFLESVFTFMLPGDRFLVAKGACPADEHASTFGAGLTYECVEPFRRWHKSFHGLARLVSGDQLRRGPLPDGPHLAVDMDLIWEGAGPTFDMDMSEQVWAQVKAHYQQHCRVRGQIAFGDEQLELTGFGMRDHSWGPRDLAQLGNHVWIYGEFPSGRRIMYFHHATPTGGGLLEHGHELDRQMRPIAKVGQLAVPRAPAGWGADYEVEFRRADGDIRKLRGEILTAVPLALDNGSELILGAPGATASHHLFESASRFEWDGEIGYGITEWSWRTDQ
jgi:hypothetical protein